MSCSLASFERLPHPLTWLVDSGLKRLTKSIHMCVCVCVCVCMCVYMYIYIYHKTKPYPFSSSHIITSKHLNLKIITLKYLNQYGFSQKSICSYKYDCLIIHKLWASRLGKISVAEGAEVVFTSDKISIKRGQRL